MNTNGTQQSNNLEKAYEDLEREIRDIKNKLQWSMAGAQHYPAPGAYSNYQADQDRLGGSAMRPAGASRQSFKSPSGTEKQQ